MKIFAKEIADGIAEQIQSNMSVACLSLAQIDNLPHNQKPLEIAVASANPHQTDLFYLKSILVSTGWNNNDDVFMPEILWAARHTPEDKQFNFMHNEKDIIGHMTGSYATDFEGNEFSDIDELHFQIPSDFNIVNNAVIYTSWTDADLQARCEKTIAEIKDGKWFVSMECLFPSFDYQLKSEAGVIEYITRNEATAHLSKHLRAYGGTGVYEGYKVGRVLKDFAFSGVGLVNKPANPKSVIIIGSTDSEKVELSDEPVTEEELVHCAANNKLDLSNLEKNDMSKELELELEGVKAKLVEAEATIASLTSFKTEAETLSVNLKDVMAQIESTKAELTGTKATLLDVTKARDEAVAKWQGFEKKMKDEKRKAALAEAGCEDDDYSYLDNLNDEAFDKIVAAMKKVKCKKDAETEDKEKVMCNKEETEAKEISITVETEKAAASLNDIAEPTKTPSLQEVAASWMSTNVLKFPKK
jgi:hypothetical protein